jgi:hypothetical protein
MMRAMKDYGGEVAGARLTPYELIFGRGDEVHESEVFPGVREEAGARAVDAADPERFVQLSSVGAELRELLADDAPGAAIGDAGHLLFQAYHFWQAGRRLVVVERGLARRLLSDATRVGEWELVPPFLAGYLQLPPNLVWARVSDDSTPEPVDGFFWSVSGPGDAGSPRYERLDVLLALGLRPDRPGLSVVAVSAPLPTGPGHWADARARPAGAGADFSSTLPGGELSRLHSLANEAEVLKLVSLLFHHAATHPEALLEPRGAVEPAGATSPRQPPSKLPFHLLRDAAPGG